MPQVAVTVSSGDEAGRQHHFQGKIASEAAYEDVEVRVGEGEKGFSMEIWAQVAETYAISITSPSGEVIPPISVRFGRGQEIDFIFRIWQVQLACLTWINSHHHNPIHYIEQFLDICYRCTWIDHNPCL